MVHAHPKFAYEKGLHQIGNGAYAWLQPDGGGLVQFRAGG